MLWISLDSHYYCSREPHIDVALHSICYAVEMILPTSFRE